MELLEALEHCRPWNEQEEQDLAELLRRLRSGEELYSRDNAAAHLTASAWVVNPQRTRTLMVYHRLYDSWSWAGGHADGEEDLLAVALREVREETGLSGIKLLDGFRESVEYSPKPGVKKQVVYFLGTTQQEKLVRQEEEISEIMWAPLSRAADLVSFANDKRLIRHAQRRMGLLPAEPAQAAEPAGGEEKAP